MELTDKKKIAILMSIFIISIIGAVISLSLVLSQKPTQEYLLKSKDYNLTYIGNPTDNKLNGDTKIKSSDGNFSLNGTFKDGVFVKGIISLKYDGVEYYLDGEFNDFNIVDGKITIITNDKIIYKEGVFIDNKLDGNGAMRIEDKNTGEILFNYSGKFESDVPQY